MLPDEVSIKIATPTGQHLMIEIEKERSESDQQYNTNQHVSEQLYAVTALLDAILFTTRFTTTLNLTTLTLTTLLWQAHFAVATLAWWFFEFETRHPSPGTGTADRRQSPVDGLVFSYDVGVAARTVGSVGVAVAVAVLG